MATLCAAPAAGAGPPHEGRFLVRLREGHDARAWAGRAVRGRIRHGSTAVPGLYVVDVPPGLAVADAVAASKRDPAVLYAEPDHVVEAVALPNDPQLGNLWGLANTGQTGGTPDADIDAPEAWNLTAGSPNVVIAVIDSGVDYTHPDLLPNLFRNEADCDGDGLDDDADGFADDCYGIDTANDDGDPFDDNKHGTHVAGTIGAAGNNGRGVVGVNWSVRLVSCKFLGAGGAGNVSDAIRCLDYAKALKDGGVNLLATSNSWGSSVYSQALADAIDAQRESGILFVAAAGNGGQDADRQPLYPAGIFLPNVISVAATTHTDSLAAFSTFGRRAVHLGAPGATITSTLPAGAYGALSGTSMAAPHVTGVAALLAAYDPSLDWRAIRNLLLAGGDAIGALDGKTVTGRRLNAYGALACSDRVVRARLQPRADRLIASVGYPISVAALHIRCAAPDGDLTVSVPETGDTIALSDDGVDPDPVADDGIYSARWAPPSEGTFTLLFPDADAVTVEATDDAIGQPQPAPGEWFGYATATVGSDVVVGAPFDNLAGPAAGAAYRVDPVSRLIEQTYVSPDPAPFQRFGWAVASDGARVLVGAPLADVGAINTGAVHLFDAASGALLHTFANPAGGPDDFFGAAVAFGPGTVIVGAPNVISGIAQPDPGFGAAYVFDAITFAHLATLHVDPPSPNPFDNFGVAIAVVGNTMAIGAPAFVHLFDGDLASPSFGQLVRTIPFGQPFSPSFGASLAAVGTRLAIGDPIGLNAEPDGLVPGIVHVYDPATGERLARIRNPLPTRIALFGGSIAALGSDLVVGAPEILPGQSVSGTGRVFVMDAVVGSMKKELTSAAVSLGDGLGTSVTVVDGRIVAGAPYSNLGGIDSGTIVALDPALVPPPPVAFASRCYRASSWTPTQVPPPIMASDLFETAMLDPFPSVGSFCTPASMSGSPVGRADAHLACFKTRNAAGQLPFTPLTIDVDTVFGQSLLQIKAGTELCLASAFDLGTPPSDLDDMRCYKVGPAAGSPRFSRREADLGDRYTAAHTLIVKPWRYCVPTAIAPRVISPASRELLCFKAKDRSATPPLPALGFVAQTRLVPVAPRLKKLASFCVAATRVPLPPPPF